MRAGRLLPSDDASSRSLGAVVAILAFLAALATAGAEIAATASSGWRAEIGREATIQLRPIAGRDAEADLSRAVALARGTKGVAAAAPLTTAEAERLLEPWLGRGLDLGGLPVPRLVRLEVASPGEADLAGLAARLKTEIPGATLDDHRHWLSSLSNAAEAVVAVAIGLVALVLAATALAVGFATQGAVAGARSVVEVLHLVGADDRFLVRLFAARFARLGLVAAVVGVGGASLALALFGLGWRRGDELTGTFEVGWRVFAFQAALAAALAAIAALSSVASVKRFLRRVDRP